jgi:DNA-binding PadR family transcriptional regulator
MAKKNNSEDASRASLIVLFCLRENDLSGYALRRLLAQWNVTSYVRISPATIYRTLARLEKEGKLSSRTARKGNYPPATVYSITEAGRRYYEELMCREAEYVRTDCPSHLLLSCGSYLPVEERIKLVRGWQEGARRMVRRLQQKVESRAAGETYGKPYAEWLLLHHEIHLIQAEIDWMDHYCDLLKQGNA